MYMRLRRKKGKCPDCPPTAGDQYLTNGKCEIHYWGQTRVNAYKQRAELKQVLITDLNDWYRLQHEAANYVCENCGDRLVLVSNYKIIKSHHAHILPKAQFPSVALHQDNHLLLCGILTGRCCHALYDSCWEVVPQLSVYPLVIEKFKLFKEYLTDREVGKLPDFLLEVYHNY